MERILIVDDIVDTAGTLINGIKVLKESGAKEIYIASTHALLSGEAVQRLQTSPITKIFFTDSLQIPPEKVIDKMEILSVSGLLADAIRRIHEERSISDLFPLKGPLL